MDSCQWPKLVFLRTACAVDDLSLQQVTVLTLSFARTTVEADQKIFFLIWALFSNM